MIFWVKLNAMTTGSKFPHNQINDPDNEKLGKMSLNQLIEKTVSPGRSRVLCGSLLRASCPGIDNLNFVSALWFLVMLSGAGGVFEKFAVTLSKKKRFFVEGGFENVVNRLEQKIVDLGASIRRSEDVVKIENNERAIYVTTARGNARNIFKRVFWNSASQKHEKSDIFLFHLLHAQSTDRNAWSLLFHHQATSA